MSDSIAHNEYGSLARLLHWVTVLLVLFAWATGVFGDNEHDRGDVAVRGLMDGVNVHIGAGLLILMIAALRFPWRIAHPPPPTEANEFNQWLISWTDPAARLTQYGLYVLLLSVPIVGVLTQFMQGHSLSLFGVATVVSPFTAMPRLAHGLKEIHEILAHTLLIVASFHAIAAVIHHVVFRDNTLSRMLPWANVIRSKDS